MTLPSKQQDRMPWRYTVNVEIRSEVKRVKKRKVNTEETCIQWGLGREIKQSQRVFELPSCIFTNFNFATCSIILLKKKSCYIQRILSKCMCWVKWKNSFFDINPGFSGKHAGTGAQLLARYILRDGFAMIFLARNIISLKKNTSYEN